MINKIYYLLANISLITSAPVVLMLALAGVDEVAGIETLTGFVLMILCGVHLVFCGISMAKCIRLEFKDQ